MRARFLLPAQAPAQQFAHRPVALPVGNAAIGRRLQRRLHSCLPIQRQEPVDTLGADPQRRAAVQGNAAGTTRCGQRGQPCLPLRVGSLCDRQHAQPHQCLVHFFGIARLWPGLFAHCGNRLRIELAQVVAGLRRVAATLHGLGTAFFQRRIVEKCIRTRIQGFGGQRRRRGQVARDQRHRARFQAAQNLQPAVAIHGVMQAIFQGLCHQRVVGHLAFADQILRTGHLVREYRGEQIFGLHALQLRRHLVAATEARQRHCVGGVPAPAHAE